MYFLKNKCEIFKTNMKNRADSILLKKCELCKKSSCVSLWDRFSLFLFGLFSHMFLHFGTLSIIPNIDQI